MKNKMGNIVESADLMRVDETKDVVLVGAVSVRADKLIAVEATRDFVHVYIEGIAAPICMDRQAVTDSQLKNATAKMLKWCGGKVPVLTINEIQRNEPVLLNLDDVTKPLPRGYHRGK